MRGCVWLSLFVPLPPPPPTAIHLWCHSCVCWPLSIYICSTQIIMNLIRWKEMYANFNANPFFHTPNDSTNKQTMNKINNVTYIYNSYDWNCRPRTNILSICAFFFSLSFFLPFAIFLFHPLVPMWTHTSHVNIGTTKAMSSIGPTRMIISWFGS